MNRRNFYNRALVCATLLLAMICVPATRALANDEYGDFEMHGVIESLPASGLIGDWVVSGRVVHVTASTWVKQEHGQAAVGAPVEVKGDLLADNSVNGRKVEVEGPGSGGDDNGGGSGDDNGGDDNGDDNGGDNGGGHGSDDGPGDDNGGDNGGGHGSDDGVRGEVKFFGTVESMTDTTWVVVGRTVRLVASTVVEREHGVTPAVGSYVEVEGRELADASVEARKIEVKSGGATTGTAPGYIEFRAAIDALPASGLTGDWTIGGRTVHVTDSTRIEQRRNKTVREGAAVEVRGNQRPDGSVDAGAIEVKSAKSARSRYAKVYGTIDDMPSSGFVGTWVVSGRTVTVTARTLVKQELGQAVFGALVEVKGRAQADGAIEAVEIEVKDGSGTVGGGGYIEFRGTVERMPQSGYAGEWIVAGRRVIVAAGVPVRGTVRTGAIVEVEGSQRTDGTVDAVKIHLED
jgi:DNA-binding transcriptional regulator of glucitol operon